MRTVMVAAGKNGEVIQLVYQPSEGLHWKEQENYAYHHDDAQN